MSTTRLKKMRSTDQRITNLILICLLDARHFHDEYYIRKVLGKKGWCIGPFKAAGYGKVCRKFVHMEYVLVMTTNGQSGSRPRFHFWRKDSG